MSAWKLVEAVPEENKNEINHEAPTPAQASHIDTSRSSSTYGRGSGRGRGRSSVPPIADGSGRGRGRHSNSTSSSSPNNNSSSSTPRYPGPYRNHQDRSYFSYLACQQIDQIFNPDSLCIDTFIRSYMDEAGYVPLSLVVTYQNVASFQCTYNDILKKMKEVVGKCKYIELDSDNETIRLKTGWEKFLMPNGFGGRGLPRYQKQASTNNHTSSSTTDNSTTATNTTTPTNQDVYAYYATQAAAFGGYYPAEFAYDPYYQYYDPNAYTEGATDATNAEGESVTDKKDEEAVTVTTTEETPLTA